MNNNWITVKELADIKGITPRAVRKSAAKNKYVTRLVEAGKGYKYEILVDSLDNRTQNLIDFEKSKCEIEKTDCQQRAKGNNLAAAYPFSADNQANMEPILRKNNTVPIQAQKIALARYDLINLWVDYRKTSASKTKACKEFIELYNTGKPYPYIYGILGQVSIGTIYRWYKAIKVNGDYTKLIPNYNYGQREKAPKLTHEEELVFKNLLLSPNKINIGKAVKLTKFVLEKRGIVSHTSERNFRRYAEYYKKHNYDRWILAREGQKALRDKVQPYITRDISKLEVGDVLVADGHRLAVQCINPFTGKPCRAVLIGYLDWKSTALAGYEIMLEENTQAITSALRNAIINLGKMPKICYQDNGKAFRAKFFMGDLYESGINGLFNKLDITPVFAQPYNARAKVIERFFRELQDGFERLLPSFVGASISDKPAYLKRNEKFHKNSHKDFIPTLEQLTQMLDMYMEFHLSKPCPNVKGKTIGEVFNEGKGSGVDINTLDDLMMAAVVKTIGRNGIRFLKADYYNDCLYGLRGRVIVKYSLSDLSRVKIFNLNNEFISEAQRVIPVHPMANYLGDVKDCEELKYRIKQQKTLEKQTIKELKNYFKSHNIKTLDWQMIPEIKAVQQPEITIKTEPEPTYGRPNFEFKYQRYEWHLQNGFENDKDVAWFKEYELSEEYKQIYRKEKNESCIC